MNDTEGEQVNKNDGNRMDNNESKDRRGPEDAPFDGTTTRSVWDKLKNTADRLVHRTVEAAEDVAQRGRIEFEIASINLRLRALYARLGKTVFILSEGEDHPNPLEDMEVQKLFDEIRDTLAELAWERRNLEEFRQRERWTGQ